MQLGKGVFSLEDSITYTFFVVALLEIQIFTRQCVENKVHVFLSIRCKGYYGLTSESQAGASLQNHKMQVTRLYMKKGFWLPDERFLGLLICLISMSILSLLHKTAKSRNWKQGSEENE